MADVTLTDQRNSSIHEEAPTSSRTIVEIPVDRIRPEEGLARRRDRDGHRELQRSIEQVGVLTPISVRPANDGSGDYLLIKGQGRTLACRLLKREFIPAIVVANQYSETEKAQQFLVENVARLKMRPIDRALLICRARASGEETRAIAERFGVTPTTVRRLLAQLEGAGVAEVAALRSGNLNLATHLVVSRRIPSPERDLALRSITSSGIRTRELETLLDVLGWDDLVAMGRTYSSERLSLLEWACKLLAHTEARDQSARIAHLAINFPTELPAPSLESESESA